jgi:sterol desaturase/sphingolipid hydroxylase (fatty acid hydroxylase superfamily)
MSPLVHLAQIGTMIPLYILSINGLNHSVYYAWYVTMVPNLTQHLGCDPLPWLTRLNHYYFYGALPWIPLYHMYHHNPYVKAANFGNTTAFWDYLFGTTCPECTYHIENGRAMDKILDRFRDPAKLEKNLESMFTVGKGLNRLDLNNGYNKKMFSWSIL